MPVPKRYFHVSQELNHDPELWEFTAEFGDRALRTWMQILVYLDRSANQWRTSGDWLATLSRTVRQSVANVSRQIRWLSEKGWLTVGEATADGSPHRWHTSFAVGRPAGAAATAGLSVTVRRL